LAAGWPGLAASGATGAPNVTPPDFTLPGEPGWIGETKAPRGVSDPAEAGAGAVPGSAGPPGAPVSPAASATGGWVVVVVGSGRFGVATTICFGSDDGPDHADWIVSLPLPAARRAATWYRYVPGADRLRVNVVTFPPACPTVFHGPSPTRSWTT